MNKKKLILLMSLVTVVVMTIVLSLSTVGIAKVNNAKSLKLKLKKPDITDIVFVAINNWNYVMRNQGSYMYDNPDADGNGNNAGGEFPRGSGTTIVYAGGLYIGTLKGGVPVVSETEFSSEFSPGPITNSGVPFASLVADNPLSAANQVYLIDRSASGDDYSNWPSDAPVNFLGQPGLIADAQTWAVFNDLDISLSSESPAESPNPGLGMNVVLESFAFNAGPLSDVVYFKFTITNKTDADYPDSYLGMWMDADVGANSSNDIVGVDTARGLGYVYNNTTPAEGGLDYATGFDFFQGPVVNEADIDAALASKNAANKVVLVYDPNQNIYVPTTLPAGKIWLGATSFNTYANGTDPVDNEERYNLLRGADKSSGIQKFGCGLNDYYAFRGNPITGQGTCDVAGANNPQGGLFATAADQRILHGVGPFTIAAGDVQEIWVGVIGAPGGIAGPSSEPRLNAVFNMFQTDDIAQATFQAGLIAPAPPASPKISVTALDGEVSISWQNNAENTFDLAGRILGINTANGYTDNYDSTDFQGYRVYRSRTGLPGSYTMLAQFDLVDGLTTVVNRTINDAGNVEIEEINVGTDNGLKYHYVDRNATNGQVYYYSVTAYDAQPYIATPDFIAIGEQTVRYAEGTAVGLSNISGLLGPTLSRTAYLDSADFVNRASYRPGGAPGLLEDTVTIDTSTVTVASYNAKTFVVLDVVIDHQYATSLAPIGEVTTLFERELTFPETFNNNATEATDHHTVGAVTFVTLSEETLLNEINKPSGLPISLESAASANVVSAVPNAPITSLDYNASVGSLTHATGVSDGYIEVQVLDPEKVTGHNYRIEFQYMPLIISGDTLKGVTVGQTYYKVFDVTANGYMKFSSRTDDPRTFLDRNNDGRFNGTDSLFDESYYGTRVAQFDADVTDEEFLVGDGLLWKIYGPATYFNSLKYLPGADYAAITPASTTRAWWRGHWGRNFADQEYESMGLGSPANGMTPYNFTNYGGPVLGSGGDAYNKSVSIVFSRDSTKWQYIYSTTGGSGANRRYCRVPFQVFEIDPTDGNATPRQLNMRSRDRNTAGTTSNAFGLFTGGLSGPDALNDGLGPQTRGFYFVDTTTYDLGSKTGHAGALAGTEKLYGATDYFSSPSYLVWTPAPIDRDLTAHPGLTDGNDWNLLCRSVIGGTAFGQGTQGYVYRLIPDEGTIEAIVNHPYTNLDSYTFSTSANSVLSKAAQKKNMKDIKVVPNPYYGRSSYQASLFDKQVKFTNLPGTCTIKIFTVSGDLVATINHNSTSNNDRVDANPLSQTVDPASKETSVERWNLQNSNGKFVASGMYIALVEAKGVGKKLVKFAIIQEQIQINGPDNR